MAPEDSPEPTEVPRIAGLIEIRRHYLAPGVRLGVLILTAETVSLILKDGTVCFEAPPEDLLVMPVFPTSLRLRLDEDQWIIQGAASDGPGGRLSRGSREFAARYNALTVPPNTGLPERDFRKLFVSRRGRMHLWLAFWRAALKGFGVRSHRDPAS